VIGERGLAKGAVEYKGRSQADARELPLDEVIATLTALKETI
jgi:hypothetical protein